MNLQKIFKPQLPRDRLLIVIIFMASLIILIAINAPKKADTATTQPIPCAQEPTPTQIARYKGHHFVVVMGSAYKVTRMPGGEWEIVGKLERYEH